MSRSVGIITIDKVNNYGADLQAFALLKKLQNLGYNSELIDYIYYKDWTFHDTKRSKPLIRMGFAQKASYIIKYRILNFILSAILPKLHASTKRRQKRYSNFHCRMDFGKTYKSIDDLYNHPPVYDVYMVGSDQVWNPYASSSIEPYFLTFASKGSKKVSYASSIGVGQLPKETREVYRKWLNDFSHIGVREASGASLIKEITGRDSQVVLDPTLLLNKEEWSGYMSPIEGLTGNYVLIYELLPSTELEQLALHYGAKNNLPVYSVCKQSILNKKVNGIQNIEDAGPGEFLWLIAHAAFVFTNSFHGTAFSVNFSTPFACVVNKNRKNNDRMMTLLNSLSLTNRIVYEGKDAEGVLNEMPDTFDNYSLEDLRKKSIEYLNYIVKA